MVSPEDIYVFLEDVKDPEVPVLSIIDLGIVRKVEQVDTTWKITITPTYSGCPAMQVIEEEIKIRLSQEGISSLVVNELSPAWTTDCISAKGRENLRNYGIAPPEHEVDKSVLFSAPTVVPCPKCNSRSTKMVSLFGSTACKAHYQCLVCLEPFDYFKCLK